MDQDLDSEEMSCSDVQETYFNLKTLTLRDRLQNGGSTSNSISCSQQHIVSQSPTPTSHSYLTQVKVLLHKHWRWLAAFLIGASYIIFILALHSYNYQLIATNTQLIKLQSSISSSKLISSSSLDMSSSSYSPASGKLTEKSSVKVVTNHDPDANRQKSIFLSLSSQQSQISNLRKSLDETKSQLKSLRSMFERSRASSATLLESLVRESNLTLCTQATQGTQQNSKLVAPLKAIYRVHFSAKVHGNTYINRKMFEISKNGEKLRNGGVIRIRYNGTENRSVECGVRGKNTCFFMEESLLVNLKPGDFLRVDDLFSTEGGQVYDKKFCMTFTDINKIPGDEESLLITH